jgi:hypothetical protein
MSRAKLKATATTSELLSGFAMVSANTWFILAKYVLLRNKNSLGAFAVSYDLVLNIDQRISERRHFTTAGHS